MSVAFSNPDPSVSRGASTLQAFVKALTSGTKDILYKGDDPLHLFIASQRSTDKAISPFDVVKIKGSSFTTAASTQNGGESKHETVSLESKTSGDSHCSSNDSIFPNDVVIETTVLKLAAKHSLPLFMHILDVLKHAKANSAKHVELVERWSLHSLHKESKAAWETTWTVLHELVDASDADVSMKMEERGVALKKLIALYQMEDRRTPAGNLEILCQRKAVRDDPPIAQCAFGWKEEGVTNLMRNRRTQRSNRRGEKYGRKASPVRSSMIATRATNARNVTLAHMFKDFVLRVRRNFTYSLPILFNMIVSFYQESLTRLCFILSSPFVGTCWYIQSDN